MYVESVTAAPLVLYLQVNSFDFWNRYRVEGYGFAEIPVLAGKRIVCSVCLAA